MRNDKRSKAVALGGADLIDADTLPARCLIDTGVFIRALRDREDDETPGCVAFFEAMIRAGRTMLLAAPSLAEALRGNPSLGLPLTMHLEHVPFDRRAAELFGKKLTVNVLRAESANTGLSHTYLKYDAMIVATAKRHDAECIVAIDGDHAQLARQVDLGAKRPSDFMLPVYRTIEEQRRSKKAKPGRRG